MKRHKVPKFSSTFRGDPVCFRVSLADSRSGNLYCAICDGKSRFIWSNSSKNYPHSPVTEKVNVFLYPVVPVFRRNVPRPRLSSLLVRATCSWQWVWSNGGMIVTGENWSTGRKTLYSVDGRWTNEYGAMVEWYWQAKTEVLGEKHYTAWVVDGWMSMEQWWNDTDRGKLKYWEKNIIQRGW